MSDEPKRIVGKPFTPGVSGNPGGRKRGREAAFFDAVAAYESDVTSAGEAGPKIVQRLIKLALGEEAGVEHKDSIAASKVLLPYLYGVPKQTLEVTGETKTPEESALLDAIKMTPYERRQRIAELGAEDVDGDVEVH